ncbi:signal peptidase II [Candidatus Dependentiae bacterium]
MRKYSSLFWYVALFMLVLLTDRATKIFALLNTSSDYYVTSFLKFDLLFNRGMSWGMFDSQSSLIFFLVSLFICLVTVVIAFYAYARYKSGHSIVGETMVVAGSFSNILDRIFYGGVIDFISIHVGAWSWPVFNIADACIVIGVIVISIGIWKQK